MASAADREKALETALAQIDRQFGKGSVMRLGSDERAPVEVIPTGSIALDVALGIGGLPRGRIVEIYGPESSGKTTLTLHAIANVQKQGGIAAFMVMLVLGPPASMAVSAWHVAALTVLMAIWWMSEAVPLAATLTDSEPVVEPSRSMMNCPGSPLSNASRSLTRIRTSGIAVSLSPSMIVAAGLPSE